MHTQVKTETVTLLDQLLGLEEAPQIEHLPGGQSQETTHAENAEVQHAAVCWLYNRIKTTNSNIHYMAKSCVLSVIFKLNTFWYVIQNRDDAPKWYCLIDFSEDPQKSIQLFQQQNMHKNVWKRDDMLTLCSCIKHQEFPPRHMHAKKEKSL